MSQKHGGHSPPYKYFSDFLIDAKKSTDYYPSPQSKMIGGDSIPRKSALLE
jgi:hypothetical protein